jgi:hypothetical protein
MRRKVAFVLVVAMLVAAMLYYYFSIKFEIGKNDLLEQQIEQQRYGDIYDFYIDQDIVVQQRPFIGAIDSHITFIVVVDFSSESAKQFYNDIVLPLESEYLQTGQARLYHKYIVSRQEYEQKTGRFIYAAAAACTNSISSNKRLFELKGNELPAFIKEQGITSEELDACGQMLYEDMFQTDTYRIYSPSIYIGIDTTKNSVLYGSPTLEQISRRVRQKQIQLGI